MRTINKVLGGIVIAGAAFGTVGTGAGATFTDAIHAQQKITAGTMAVSVSSNEPGASDNGKSPSRRWARRPPRSAVARSMP